MSKKQYVHVDVENPVNDQNVKNLTDEITNDVELNIFEKKEQLLSIIDKNDLNVNQTIKINRIIDGLRPSGRSYGQTLIDAETISSMD